jgi:D-alanyl-D-alanine dipeptidase
VELRYATEDNFTGERIYPFADAYLRYGTVKKLLLAQDTLRAKGLGLKLWDAFRPVSAQFTLWEVCPDPRYVADPRTGFSSHSRGNTVDITLVDAMGQELPMPTGFDDFSALADRNYSDCPEEAAQNALLLQSVMEEAGFTGYFGEWWHFSDTDAYTVEQTFEPLEPHLRLAVCEEYITLRAHADTASEALARIPKNGIFTVLARQGAFLLVSCDGLRGYVLESYTQTIQ